MYIVDSSDPDRFDEAKEAFDKMIQNRALEGVPLLIIANKQDLDVGYCASVSLLFAGYRYVT